MREFDVIDAPQRSPEWFAARLGRLTGSRAGDMLSTVQRGEAAARRDLRVQLIVERITSELEEDDYINAAMQHGIDTEPLALAAYEAATGNVLAPRTGFLAHRVHMAGCSLDGHVGDFEGIVEVKCPKQATHLRWLRAGVMPPEHVPQLLHNLWVSGAQFADWVSYDNRWPPGLDIFIVRVERNERDIAAYEQRALAFLKEVDKECAEVEALWARRRAVAPTLADTLREVIAHA